MFPGLMALLDRNAGLARRADLTGLGLTDAEIARLIRSRRLVAVRRGVYADGAVWSAADSFHDRPALLARAVHMTTLTDHVMSHHSAAALLRLPTLQPPDGLQHVTRPDVHGGRTEHGVKHHVAPYHPDQVVEVDQVPCLDRARTALDIAREHGYRHGLVAADGALRSGCSRADLAAAAEPMRNWPQVTTVRRVVEGADPGAESVGETLARELVEELGIGRPQTQFVVTDGSRIVWCDLRVGRQIFEFDGLVKYLPVEAGGVADRPPEEVVWDEKRRQDFICSFKLGVSRIIWEDFWGSARRRAKVRLRREYDDTVARFGTDISDLL